ncbi:DUF1820 family protein [Legionella yabuuchiae]|uniref:DUF1820 family protein n=1 Tax=Legionella yabuuchiae TaxID=376727 RepID=UPI001056DDC2|nr:DUF1820 family protein [Legionella yabuuchiae]
MSNKTLYRITFSYLEAIYEIYARKICESDMFGFLEVQDFVFGENSALVVDPSEERLKHEFHGVNRTFIPMHSIYRIDEVDKVGDVKVRDKGNEPGKVSMFPIRNKNPD